MNVSGKWVIDADILRYFLIERKVALCGCEDFELMAKMNDVVIGIQIFDLIFMSE